MTFADFLQDVVRPMFPGVTIDASDEPVTWRRSSRVVYARGGIQLAEVIAKVPLDASLLERARHYYVLRNKLIHERATVGITDADVSNYRRAIEQILSRLFDLKF